MNDFSIRKKIRRSYATGNSEVVEDDVVKESRLLIRLDGKDFIQAVITPSQVEEYVVGFLRTRGLIQTMNDIASLEVAGEISSVMRISHLAGVFPELDLLETTGSRNVGKEHALRHAEKMSESHFRLSSKSLMQGVGMLAEMPLYKKTGGTHCAILFSQKGDPLVASEDIGRHNAVDKTVGGGLMKRVDFKECWLAVSGRLPADMVLKPLLLGIPLVASVSAPTSEGIEVGERSGLTVVGFVRGGRLNCYCHPERIE
jgi:FdhD protein